MAHLFYNQRQMWMLKVFFWGLRGNLRRVQDVAHFFYNQIPMWMSFSKFVLTESWLQPVDSEKTNTEFINLTKSSKYDNLKSRGVSTKAG